MTNYIILVLCIIVILSYLFDIAGSYVKIPGVIFLIFLGIAIQFIVKATNLSIQPAAGAAGYWNTWSSNDSYGSESRPETGEE
jgi:hypothetical protein